VSGNLSQGGAIGMAREKNDEEEEEEEEW